VTNRPNHPPFRRGLIWRLAVALPLVASLGLLVLGIYVLTRPKKSGEYTLKMLTDLLPGRRRLAERIAAEARLHGLEVKLSARPYGALEELGLVNATNDIDVAIVPGGVGKGQFSEVRQVTALSVEPLHLLVKFELQAEASKSLRVLRGKRVNTGPTTTATNLLGRDVLRFVGLLPRSASGTGKVNDSYQAEALNPQELIDRAEQVAHASETDRARLLAAMPDAVFVLSPMPSDVAKALVRNADFRLVALPFSEAYTLDHFDQDVLTPEQVSVSTAEGKIIDPDRVRIDRAAMTTVEIPPYTYSTDPPVPETPCRTIGDASLLISYAPTQREGVAKLLEVIFDSPIRNSARPVPLSEQVPQFPFHSGTEYYLASKRPFWTPELASQLGKLLGGAGAFASGLVAFYGFLKLRQLRRFESYYHEIRRIELIARGLENEPGVPPLSRPAERASYLEDRLNALKCEALKDFADGGLKGEGLMSGIAALVNDTRDSLDRLAAGEASASSSRRGY
jgi:hypothetical protein